MVTTMVTNMITASSAGLERCITIEICMSSLSSAFSLVGHVTCREEKRRAEQSRGETIPCCERSRKQAQSHPPTAACQHRRSYRAARDWCLDQHRERQMPCSWTLLLLPACSGPAWRRQDRILCMLVIVNVLCDGIIFFKQEETIWYRQLMNCNGFMNNLRSDCKRKKRRGDTYLLIWGTVPAWKPHPMPVIPTAEGADQVPSEQRTTTNPACIYRCVYVCLSMCVCVRVFYAWKTFWSA